MCGISGFAGLQTDQNKKLLLTYALGFEIDSRGGHAAGYVSVNGKISVGKKLGTWADAKDKFVHSAASGDVAMLHARFATCGKRGVNEAHPFTIKRNGRTVLYGIHNGVVYNAWESAKKHGRDIIVDSQEIFHLLADDNIKGLNSLDGYGVINYIVPEDPHCVRMVRLSSSSDFYICHVKTGGVVWGSTRRIVHDALEVAEIESDGEYDLSEIGTMYEIRPDQILKSNKTGLKFAERTYGCGSLFSNYSKYGHLWEYEDDDEDPPTSKLQADYEKMFDELEKKDDTDIPLVVECENCKCEMTVDEYDNYVREYRDLMGMPPDEDNDLILCDRCVWDYPKIRRAI